MVGRSGSRRRRALVAGIALAAVAGAVTAALVAHVASEPAPGGRPSMSIHVLRGPVTDHRSGVRLDPPDGGEPAVSARDAVAMTAHGEHARGVIAVHALLTWGRRYRSLPVWALDYRGTRLASHGPGTNGGCTRGETVVLVNARTGANIAEVGETSARLARDLRGDP